MSGASGHALRGYNKCASGKDRWRVVERQHNYSAFSGYHYTPSDYSRVCCLDCGASWRTKAGYVATLPDVTTAEDTSRRSKSIP